MSEKRKPVITMIAYGNSKKKNKIELFVAHDFRQVVGQSLWRKYRIRVNGRWYSPHGKYSIFSIWEFRDIFIRSVKKVINANWKDQYKSKGTK